MTDRLKGSWQRTKGFHLVWEELVVQVEVGGHTETREATVAERAVLSRTENRAATAAATVAVSQ